ncbi:MULTISPECIES: hypothetical protein [unclassified Bradyrhizobium]|uniref:hypothetical protein n=1 Tax=unclassified Bradyrhizobium TaxID=2631580 RepID=UPI0024799C41|nr:MULTISPECIES: hypothetical protein [unclassified Bradyrhizobium]WGS22849.1 hypothetical protein MTX22_15025 [Bradyrhizobium sp. ISRA463]WGS29842.1 hypothetical protein MTX19_12770 [Bradyrhizobium sp. ISRA464]
MERLLRFLVNPAAGAFLFMVGLSAFYGVVVWYLDLPMSVHTRSDMVFLPWLAVSGVAVGSTLFFREQPSTVFVDTRGRILVYGVTCLFLAFCAVTIVTAPSLPLADALRGATPEQIAVSRENFLKARVGWAAILPYLNILLAGALLPYCICIAILRRYRFRWLVLGIFLLYTLAFVEKAFFLRLFIPLMAVVAVSDTKRFKLTWLLAVAVLLLFLNTVVSGFAESSGMNARDFLVYRALYIPIRTVTDSLDYWWKSYQGQLLLGATNLVLSQLMELPRVYFEREVFVYEWGPSLTGTSAANAAYFVEAFVNFGWIGVFAFSALLGATISYFAHSSDRALRCILLLFLFSVFVGPLISVLIGNGFLLCIIASSWVNVRPQTNVSPSDAASVAFRSEGAT